MRLVDFRSVRDSALHALIVHHWLTRLQLRNAIIVLHQNAVPVFACLSQDVK